MWRNVFTMNQPNFYSELLIRVFLLNISFIITSPIASSQSSGDYRSKASGNWNLVETWETYDGASWVDASSTPTSANGVITILNGHTVAITATVTYDQVKIDAGCQVTVLPGVTHTLANGTGTDLTVNGIWLNSGGTWTVTGAQWTVESGGTYIHNTTSAISAPLNAATIDGTSNFIYRGSGSLTPAASFSGRTYGNLYFESTSGSYSITMSGSSSLLLNGDFTIGSGVTLTNTMSSTNIFGGNFTNNGTLTNGANTQTYSFTGSGKTIGGISSTSFENLTINSGTTISLGTSISVDGTLTFTSGKLTIGSNNLTLSSVSGNDASKYIIAEGSGIVTRSIGSSTEFPVGTADYYMPLQMTGSGSFGVNLSGVSSGLTDSNKALNKQWNITGSGSPDIRFQWPAGAENSGIDVPTRGNLNLYKHNGSSWTKEAGPSAGLGSNPYNITFNGVSCCSGFTLGGTTALPISLLSFKSRTEPDAIRLLWQTASELNNDFFAVKHSTNGRDFSAIAQIPGSGTTTQTISYSYTDTSPASGTNYYRLKQVDYDGTYTYSKVIAAMFGSEAAFKVYPTQVGHNIHIVAPENQSENVKAEVYDQLGRLHRSWLLDAGQSTHALDASTLQQGLYILRLQPEGQPQQAVRFVKI